VASRVAALAKAIGLDPDEAGAAPGIASLEQELGETLDTDLRDLFVWVGENEFDSGVSFFGAREASQIFAERDPNWDTSDFVPIASDGGSGHFAVDRRGDAGFGRGAVILVSRGAPSLEHARFAAANVFEFLERTRDEFDFSDQPTLDREWTRTERDAALQLREGLLASLEPGGFTLERLHFRSHLPAQFTLSRDTVVSGLPCAARFPVQASREGRVLAAMLSAEWEIDGVRCDARTLIALREGDGTLFRYTPAEPIVVRGFSCAAHRPVDLPADPQGPFWASLASDQIVDDIPCAANATVQITAQGQLTSGTLARDATVDGVALPAGTRFERMRSDAGTHVFTIVPPRDWNFRGTSYPARSCLYLHADGTVFSVHPPSG
jgi:hypothetical protein